MIELKRANFVFIISTACRRASSKEGAFAMVSSSSLCTCSRRWAEKRFTRLVYWNELDKGGHFAAFEQPAAFVEELRSCFRHMR